MRTIKGIKNRTHDMSKEIYDMGWMTYKQWVEYMDIITLRSMIDNEEPSDFAKMIEKARTEQGRDSRASRSGKIPLTKDIYPIGKRRETFLSRAVLAYNDKLYTNEQFENRDDFKKKMKQRIRGEDI